MPPSDGPVLAEVVEKLVRGVATNLIEYIQVYACPRVALEDMMRRGPDHRRGRLLSVPCH